MNINDIKLNPNNPRFIKDERYQKLKKNMQEFPKMMKLRPIIIDDDGMIIGGNMRYLAMKDLGYKDIPEGWVVKASGLTEEERKRFIIADNVELGEFDYDKLANEWEMTELQDWGIELPEMEIEKEEDDFDVDKAIEEVKEPITKIGDIWQLGKNRVMCGDSNKNEDLQKLVKTEKADLSFCDPPYNIGYDYWDYLDNKETGEYKKWCEEWFKKLAKLCPIILLTIGQWNLKMWFDIEKPLGIINWIARNKTSGSKISLFSVWEPILVYAKKIKRKRINNSDYLESLIIRNDDDFVNDVNEAIEYVKQNDDLIEINNMRQKNIGVHKCPKQVKMLSILITRYSDINNIVLDLFLGSGSTLIACEQLNRICYGMEIDPIYCDVIIKRWENYTNKKAVKLNE